MQAVEPIVCGTGRVMEAGNLGACSEAAVNDAIKAGNLDVRAIPTAGRSWTEIDFKEDPATVRRLPDCFKETR